MTDGGNIQRNQFSDLILLIGVMSSATVMGLLFWQGRESAVAAKVLLVFCALSLFLFGRGVKRAWPRLKLRFLLGGIVVALFLVYGLAVGTLYLFQDEFLFFPMRGTFTTCGSAKQTGFDIIQGAQGAQSVRMLVRRQPLARGWILIFHGNAETSCEGIGYYVGGLESLGFNLALVEFPGYQEPGVKSSQANLTENAVAAFDFVDGLNPTHLPTVIFGRSLGTGVATFVASSRPASGLVLISPYTSIVDVAAHQFPLFPVRYLSRNPFPAYLWAPQVKAPVLAVHGAVDQTIPIEIGRAEVKLFPNLMHFIEIPGASHNDIIELPEVWTAIRGFVKGLLPH